jgi:exosortase/archaeosortase family protein
MSAPRTLWAMALVFVLSFASMQWLWSQARGTVVEQVVIHQATVGTAVRVIQAWTPQWQAQAVGPRIRAQGGGINVLNGCEGTEVLFLLLAALLAYPLAWRVRVAGVLLGTVWVFALNELRLLALFYSLRWDRSWFDVLHGLWAPLCLIVLALAFMGVLIQWDARGRCRAMALMP